MMKYGAVLFDLDNTLLDRRTSFRKFAEAFIAERFPDGGLPDEKARMIAHMEQMDADGYGSKTALYDSLIERWGLRGVSARELVARHYEEFDQFSTPDRDMDAVLSALSGEYRLGMVTNGTSAGQNGKIARLGLRDRFDAILVSGDLGIHKPDARIFTMCCEVLGVPPDRAVYVGDHYENDILGAKNAGLHPIWYPSDPISTPPDVPVIPRLFDLLNHL